ncbi:MAG: MFS transporter [Alphaproteobacteria bacterium]|nr:MFS transporter [Alphaproteobacteria bacterium]
MAEGGIDGAPARPAAPASLPAPGLIASLKGATEHKGAWAALVLLSFGSFFSIIDRYVFSILFESIRAEMAFSDTQLSLLGSGLFAFFYAIFGIPLAHLADATNRRNVVAACVTAWSVFATLTGAAVNFFTMAVCRLGVAVGESGLVPAGQSILGDYFKPHVRGRVYGVFTAMATVGSFVGMALGGLLADRIGWRWTFAVLALPGILVGIAIRFAFREPPRRGGDGDAQRRLSFANLPRAVATVWRVKAFRYLAIAGGCNAFLAQGFAQMSPAFLMRSHDLVASEAGPYIAITKGTGGLVGVLLSGVLVDRLTPKDPRWFARLPLIAMIVSVPAFFVSVLSPSLVVVAVAFFVLTATAGVNLAPTYAAAQRLIPADSRAIAIALFLLGTAGFGLGLGPVSVGIASDILRNSFGLGEESLRYGLFAALVGNVVAAILFWQSARNIPSEIDRI